MCARPGCGRAFALSGRVARYVRLRVCGRVAQLVEQRPFKAWVAGSNPAALTTCLGVLAMASLDWSQCPAVESVPGKVSGAWVFRGTRMPVQTVFENLEAGMSVDEITEVFDVTAKEVKAVLHFASESLAKAPTSG